MANNGLVVDPLFVGCTRPATLIGVPFSAFIFEGIFVLEGFIFTQNLLNLLWIIPVHAITYVICLREPRIFDLIILWAYTKGATMSGSYWFWKASTYSPLPLQVGRKVFTARRNAP